MLSDENIVLLIYLYVFFFFKSCSDKNKYDVVEYKDNGLWRADLSVSIHCTYFETYEKNENTFRSILGSIFSNKYNFHDRKTSWKFPKMKSMVKITIHVLRFF